MPLYFLLFLNDAVAAGCSARLLLHLQYSSDQKAMNSASEKTWNARPAIMMLTPASVVLLVSAVAAIPPPAACNTREKKSQVMKMIL